MVVSLEVVEEETFRAAEVSNDSWCALLHCAQKNANGGDFWQDEEAFSSHMAHQHQS